MVPLGPHFLVHLLPGIATELSGGEGVLESGKGFVSPSSAGHELWRSFLSPPFIVLGLTCSQSNTSSPPPSPHPPEQVSHPRTQETR